MPVGERASAFPAFVGDVGTARLNSGLWPSYSPYPLDDLLYHV